MRGNYVYVVKYTAAGANSYYAQFNDLLSLLHWTRFNQAPQIPIFLLSGTGWITMYGYFESPLFTSVLTHLECVSHVCGNIEKLAYQLK